MAAPRPGDGRKPNPTPAAAPAPAAAPRVGLLNKLGNAPWGVAAGLGVLLLAVGIYKGEMFAQVYGGIMIVLGVVLRIKRGR